jgi:hypothetical protein
MSVCNFRIFNVSLLHMLCIAELWNMEILKTVKISHYHYMYSSVVVHSLVFCAHYTFSLLPIYKQSP